MQYKIAPNETLEDGWTYDGTNWVKPDSNGVNWIYDGTEMAVIDSESDNLIVLRDDRVCLKDKNTNEIIAEANSNDGTWTYLLNNHSAETENDVYSVKHKINNEAKQPNEVKPLQTKIDSIASTPQENNEKSYLDYAAWERYVVSGLLDNKPSSQLYYTKMNGELDIIKHNGSAQKYYNMFQNCLKTEEVIVECLKQIQCICKYILRAAKLTTTSSYSDQILITVSITLLDIFDPSNAEVKETGFILNNSLALLYNEPLSLDQVLLKPMKSRLATLLNTRIKASMIRLSEISKDSNKYDDECIYNLATTFSNLLRYTLNVLNTNQLVK